MEHCCLNIKVEDFWQHDMFTLLKKLNENLEFLINNNTIINNHNSWCCFLSLLHWTKIEQNFRLTNQANFYFSKSDLLLQRIICLVNRKISSPICCIIVFQKLCCESHRYRSFSQVLRLNSWREIRLLYQHSILVSNYLWVLKRLLQLQNTIWKVARFCLTA